MIDYEYVKDVVVSVKEIFMKTVKDSEVHYKGLFNIVTDCDIAVQKLITNKLKEKYPDIEMIAEELDQDRIVDKNKSYFVLDPIDGTINFRYGLNHSAISLGYVEKGQVVYGIVYNPYNDEIFEGYVGKGAFLNGKRIYGNKTNTLEESVVGFGIAPFNKDSAKELFDTVYRIFMKSLEIRRLGAASLDMCYVACGRLDAYIEKDLKIWDIAAGYLIAKESDIEVLNYSGKQFDTIQHSGVIVANKNLVKELLDTM
ncbi:MAG: inositol monophosphatase [Oscillospiraceae bacterium]|nr:inositol monophosphatase [Oscillospiraceae bacterium]